MRNVVVLASLAACATTSRICPPETRLATEDRPTGRIEWCAKTVGALAMIPAQREYPEVLGTAAPATMRGGVHGPFTHWYPNGAIESHGRYVEHEGVSVPDGVWGTWHPDGTRKSVGRYDRGRPVGCFAVWDEKGLFTGVVDGDQLTAEPCDPPVDDALATAEKRSRPSGAARWGDLSLFGSAQGGALGASNGTQREPDPAPRAAFQATLRKHVGAIRVGPTLGYRMSDGEDSSAYIGAATAAFAVPLHRRITGEVGAQLGLQYVELVARRMDVAGSGGKVGFWAPLGALHGGVAFTLTPNVQLVGGASIGGWPSRDATRDVRYCSRQCSVPIVETWTIGGIAYGVDIGARLLLR